jgi:hypothetical protein
MFSLLLRSGVGVGVGSVMFSLITEVAVFEGVVAPLLQARSRHEKIVINIVLFI